MNGFFKIVVISMSLLISIDNVLAQQKKRIIHNETATENEITFMSADGKVLKTIDLRVNSVYSNLKYSSTKLNGRTKYFLEDKDKMNVLNYFFSPDHYPKDQIEQLHPAVLSQNQEMRTSVNHVVVSEDLTMYGKEGGVLGVKATASVYNLNGDKIAVMPENNDGYFEAVVTENGKYLSSNFGGVVVHEENSLLPIPGIRIYDLSSGKKIYEMQSTSEFDVLPPSTWDNIVVQVLRLRGGKYDYNIIKPEARTIYKRIFTSDEVGKIVKINRNGITIKRDGEEVVLDYETSFSKSFFN